MKIKTFLAIATLMLLTATTSMAQTAGDACLAGTLSGPDPLGRNLICSGGVFVAVAGTGATNLEDHIISGTTSVYTNTSGNSISLTTAGTTRMVVNSSGNVGIGTSIPSNKLNVTAQADDTETNYKTSGTYTQMLIQDSDVTTSGLALGYRWQSGVAEYGRIQAYNSAAGQILSLNPNGGNVGIGTPAPDPSARVHVVGGRTYLTANSEPYDLYLQYNAATSGMFLGGTSTGHLQISNAGGAALMTVQSGGNVGIGTTTPTQVLQVINTLGTYGTDFTVNPGSITLKQHSTDTSVPYIEWRDKNNTRVSYMGWGGATQFDLALENGRNLAITGGNVGIGMTGPTAKLDVLGSVVRVQNTASGQAMFYADTATNANGGLDLYENSTRKWIIYNQGSNDNLYIINAGGSGVYLSQGATSWAAASDKRLKTNIQTYPVLSRIDHFRAVSFDWKSDKSHDIGVIAQETYEVFPELVDKGSMSGDVSNTTSPGAWGVHYDRMGVLALQAVKELKAANDNQAAEIKELRARLDKIEAVAK